MTYEQALSKAAALCSSGEHCEKQIREKLEKWEVSEEDADRIIAHLIDEKYIDSARYCRAFVSDKLRYNHWGRFKLRMALRQLDLPDTDIREALEAIDEEEYMEILNKVLDAKARTLRDSDPYIRTGKLLRFITSRGFEADLARDLMED